jgi:hypothetical protein
VARCRDTARDGRGFVIALVDEDIISLLDFVRHRARQRIDAFLERKFRELVT